MERSDDITSAAVFDFLAAYLADRERGGVRPLIEYLTRFAGQEEAIAREYFALEAQAGANGALPRSGIGAGADAPDSIDRIGPYRVIREIGRGGQGVVLLAEDTRIARRVALKVLPPSFSPSFSPGASTRRIERFRREAEVIARLEHPSLCVIYEADVEGPTPYIAMRYVEGPTLAQVLSEARQPDADPALAARWPPRNALALRSVLAFFERAARALHAAHEAGVVHRDVKPGNLIVAADETPVILDFGLARDDESELATLTASDEVFGTPAYMSPEQLERSSDELDRRTDVYSLGVMLFEALTLRRPFDAPSRTALFEQIVHAPPPDVRTLNPALSEDVRVVIETALEKERTRRYATALELAEDLRRVREYEPIRARPAGAALRLSRWGRRHPALAISIGGTILALSAGLILALSLLARVRAERNDKERALVEKDGALEFALGRHLAERCVALVPMDPALALALGIEAAEREIRAAVEPDLGANYLTRSALFQALDACHLRSVLSGAPARLVTDLAIAPGQETVAIALEDDEQSLAARVFDFESGRALFDLTGGSGSAAKLAYDASGTWIATASKDGRICLWNARTGRLVSELADGGALSAIEFDLQGTRLLTVAKNGRATLREIERWTTVAVLGERAGEVEHAQFVLGGARVLSRAASDDPRANVASLWDARDGRRIAELAGHQSAITRCEAAADPACASVLTAARDGTVRIWDARSARELCAPLAHAAPVGCAAIDARGTRVLTTSEPGGEIEVRLWNLADGSSRRLEGHGDRKVIHAAFSPDGRRIATGAQDTLLRIFDVASAMRVLELRTWRRPLALRWSADSRRLAVISVGQVAHVWYAGERPDVFALRGHASAVRKACFSPDGTRALTASDDGSARLWFVPEGASAGSAREPGELLHVFAHAAAVTSARFSPDGARVLTTSLDGSARMWSADTGEPLCPPWIDPAPVLSGDFDPSGSRVLTLTSSGTVSVRKIGAVGPTVLAATGAPATCARFDPEGALVVTAGDEDRLRVFDAASGAELRELSFERKSSDPAGVVDFVFLAGRAEIAAACRDYRLRFFDVRTGERTRADVFVSVQATLRPSRDASRVLLLGLRGPSAKVLDLSTLQTQIAEIAHTDAITDGSFSADGRLVVTSSRDGTAHVWDAHSGRPVAHRAARAAALLAVGVDNGTANPRVITAFEDGTVSVWPFDPLPGAKARKPRDLSELEKAREQRLALPLVYE